VANKKAKLDLALANHTGIPKQVDDKDSIILALKEELRQEREAHTNCRGKFNESSLLHDAKYNAKLYFS